MPKARPIDFSRDSPDSISHLSETVADPAAKVHLASGRDIAWRHGVRQLSVNPPQALSQEGNKDRNLCKLESDVVAWRTALAPILIGLSRSVVSD